MTKNFCFITKTLIIFLVFFGLRGVLGFAQTAPGTLGMQPGQTYQFNIQYRNGGEGSDTMENALLYVFIDEELEIDINSITDQFPESGTQFRVSPSVVNTSNQAWGSVIEYRPRSANNPDGPSGTNIPANVDITIGEVGVLRFNARLKTDVLSRYQVGDILQPDIINGRTEGIYSVLEHSGSGKQPGQIGILILAPAQASSVTSSSVSSVSATNSCTNIASPGSTTGGGFNGTSPQPVYSGIIFNPNPGIIGQALNVRTEGLRDDACALPLNGQPCTTELRGPGGFSAQASGTIIDGVCRVIFNANQTPRTVGTYQAVTRVNGPNGLLETAPASVQFNLPVTTNTLARTGGGTVAIIAGSAAALSGGYAYYLSRRHKIKISK